ncbi:unnamed protein product [Clonostachys chloroleuca]|uniref:Aminoglycoside phosphotransferase domain-containing protein n=1 Tax=Clonostachys chloroleuca TaxID=1926264 RepID=A0AA35QD07_9HYPO|nr:unnamed protein product [Clonostachys chloroleuca]
MTTRGVEWVETQFGPRPEWTNEPDHEAILQAARQALSLNELCSVRFLAQGVFSRVYVISSLSEEYIFRLSLPMYRRWKTESEIATMEWARKNTSLPVPRVLAHMGDPSQAVGYEWIIMEKVSGKPLEEAWADMDYPCKSRLIKQLAAFTAATFEHKLRGMGSLYHCNSSLFPALPPGNLEEKTYTTSFDPYGEGSAGFPFRLGPGVCPLYLCPYLERDPQGPFWTSRDWIISLLRFAREDLQTRLKEGTGNFVQGPEGVEAITILQRLGALLDAFFPPHSASEPEPTMLYHHGLNEKNILVDDDGSITSVIDWEYISAMPLFLACDFPAEFLIDESYNTKPDMADYYGGDHDPRYWTHVRQYELTRLREDFLDEMKRLQPRVVEIFESTQHQRDFFAAITSCREHYGDPIMCEILNDWLTDMESGAADVMGLDERVFDALNSADTLSERSEDMEGIEMEDIEMG